MANRLSISALAAVSVAFFSSAALAQNAAPAAPAAPGVAAPAGNTVVGKVKTVDEMEKSIILENGIKYIAAGNVVVDAFTTGQTVTMIVDATANPPRILQIDLGG